MQPTVATMSPLRSRVVLDSTVAWSAVRSAGGSVRTAARALGVTPKELIEVLRADPPVRLGLIPHRTSGLRVRGSDDDDVAEDDDRTEPGRR